MFENLTLSQALPSLNALRAFEAMGRTGRATLAAEELGVTHSAVSRQVKALEARLGAALFSGPKHDLKLTEAGRELIDALTPAFDAVGQAVLKAQGGTLVIAANPSIAAKWLVPRLAGFAARRPRTRIELVELATHALSHRGAHAVVRILDGDRLARAEVTAFMPNFIGPVIAPELAQTPPPARLVARTHPGGWDRWSALSGATPPAAPLRALPHLHVVLEAAIAGLGVAVLPWGLTCEDVRAGRLLPVGRFVQDGAFVAIADPRAETLEVRAFKAWLMTEGASAMAQNPPPAG